MTAQEAIGRADRLLPNPFPAEEKLRWLWLLDGLLAAEAGDAQPEAYEPGTELRVKEPDTEVYEHWLEAKMLYALGEYTRYANAMGQFNAAYLVYSARRIRTEKPKKSPNAKY